MLGGCLAVLLLAGLAGCKRQASADADDEINKQKLIVTEPTVEPPAVIFPEQLKTDDVTVNEFIRKALEACRQGDYDMFRQLFGVTEQAPTGAQFDHVWKDVKEIAVRRIYTGKQQPLDYYVHVVVLLRQPDKYERTERQAVIWVFKEGDNWHLAPAPSEIQGKILYPSTRPEGESAAATRPAHRHPASRPSASTTSPAR